MRNFQNLRIRAFPAHCCGDLRECRLIDVRAVRDAAWASRLTNDHSDGRICHHVRVKGPRVHHIHVAGEMKPRTYKFAQWLPISILHPAIRTDETEAPTRSQ